MARVLSEAVRIDYDVSGQSIESDQILGANTGAQAGAGDDNIVAPKFGQAPTAFAVSTRQAGRINAAAISEEEYEALLAERQQLLDKKFAGQMSRTESNRLAYVRWSLDRIEDAKHGHYLDLLEAGVSQYERFSAQITEWTRQLEAIRRSRH